LYKHIKVFEERLREEPDGWSDFISGIKKDILSEQIASYKKNTKKSTAEL